VARLAARLADGGLMGGRHDRGSATTVGIRTDHRHHLFLKEDLQDVWGEVPAVVNFFNLSANTSVFAKLDVTFGDDSIGGKAGMRVSW
jgi:hypothetical protein